MSATDWEVFLRDIALCLSAYQDRGPAVVWPERAHTVLRGLCEEYGGEAGTGWRSAPLGTRANRLAADLSRLMGYAVDAFEHTLPAGRALAIEHRDTAVLIFSLRGGARFRIERPGSPDGERGGIELRLRAGEIFYVPAGHTCMLDDASADCPLLLLALHATP
ncbi:cupin domain-containing protein [Streptomyces milbemycinicus]|uniref:Uncharacterized protein n=1 Tax=Streptomyces milbemycinicus TaxID=476552 RepID=A0ABW8LZP4_9ACTN